MKRTWRLELGDWCEVLHGVKPDHIIMDPPYESKILLDTFRTICSGNILIFSYPSMELKGADEYLFWVKTPSTKNFSRKCGRFVEMISVFRNGGAFNSIHWSQMIGVYGDGLAEKSVHPNQKPLTLMERLVRIYTNPGDLVMDPFSGSGTTGLACTRLGRRFVGAEINEEYYETALGRLSR